MSIISKLGMAEKSALELLESKVNELDMQMSGYDKSYWTLRTEISDMKEQYAESISELQHDIDTRTDAHCRLKDQILELRDKVTRLEERYSKDSLCKRMDDMERMLRYLQNSHGKVLNDIQDLKKELHGLYGRQCPPPPEVLAKSVAKPENETELFDILRGLKMSGPVNSQVVRCLNQNGLKTLEDLHKIPYEKLCELKWCGPRNLGILQKMYGDHDARPVKKQQDYSTMSLRKAVEEVTDDPREQLYIYNKLQKNGVPNMSALAALSSDFVSNTCGFGARARRQLNKIYEKYIWA